MLQGQAVKSTEMSLSIPQKAGNLLTSWVNMSFS
jgi:hypothetical protein